jgi:hypothetical protein
MILRVMPQCVRFMARQSRIDSRRITKVPGDHGMPWNVGTQVTAYGRDSGHDVALARGDVRVRGAKAPLDSVGQYGGDGRGRGRHDDDIGGVPPPG